MIDWSTATSKTWADYPRAVRKGVEQWLVMLEEENIVNNPVLRQDLVEVLEGCLKHLPKEE